MARIKDIFQNRLMYAVDRSLTVAEAAARMAEAGVGAILVLEEGRLSGIFSERDLMLRVVVKGLDPAHTLVRDVMTTQVATIESTGTVEEAMELMDRYKCRHLPVLHGGMPAGMISMRDVIHYELERKTEEIRHMRAYIHGNA